MEGIRIRNFRVLRNVTLGKLWNLQQDDSLADCREAELPLGFRRRMFFREPVLEVKSCCDHEPTKPVP